MESESWIPLSEEERNLLLWLARETIRSAVQGYAPPVLEEVPPLLAQPGAAFVTLYLDQELRGCVGTIEARQPLYRAVMQAARAAALEDVRFTPVRPEEVDRLAIEISRLSPLRPARPEEILPGIHGVCLEVGNARAVFLPKVALEQGWSREELLDHLARKARLPPQAWRDEEARLFVFTAEVFASPGLAPQ
jgi:AmmeMemoRadiSam system protein A